MFLGKLQETTTTVGGGPFLHMFAYCFFLGPWCGLTRFDGMCRNLILAKFATSLNFYIMVRPQSCHWKFSLCSLKMFFGPLFQDIRLLPRSR